MVCRRVVTCLKESSRHNTSFLLKAVKVEATISRRNILVAWAVQDSFSPHVMVVYIEYRI